MFASRGSRFYIITPICQSRNKNLTTGLFSLLLCCASQKSVEHLRSFEVLRQFCCEKQKHCFSTNYTTAFSNALQPICVGSKVVITKTISSSVVKTFAEATGDWNPVHFPVNELPSTGKSKAPIVHGALLNGIVSGVIGTQLPGPGTVVVSQTINYPSPLPVGSQVDVEVEVIECKRIQVVVQYKVISRVDRLVVMDGVARLMVPKGRIGKVS